MATQPPTIGTIPTPPDFVNRQATAHAEAVAMFTALKTVAPQIDAVGQITYQNAVSVELSAAVANARQWASGTYSAGAVVWSPIATAAGTPTLYIRKEPGGASPTDPANDPTNWVKYVTSNTTGGAVYTTSTTLTSVSPFAIKITGKCGTWIKLPDATTLQTGARYSICNTGSDDVRVLDFTGSVMGFIRPRDAVAISCADASTPSGGWIHGLEEAGITQRWQALPTTLAVNNIKASVRIDSDRVMFLIGGQSGSQLHAVVWSDAAGGIGATYLVRAAAYHANAVLCGAGQVVVVSADNSTAMQGVVLTVTGTSIAAGSVSSVTLSLSCTGIGQLIATPTGFALSFVMGSSGCVRGLAISGGSPTFGSENILALGNIAGAYDVPRLYLSGNVVRTVRYTLGIEAKPFTASGATLTAGTPVTTATSIYTQYKTALLNNGNLAVLHFNSGKFVLSILKLNGTVESVYSVNLSGTVTAPSNRAFYDFQPFGAKVVTFCYSHNSASPYSALSVAVVTDNSGSATVGTIYQRVLSTSDVSGSFNLSYIPSALDGEFGVNLRYASGANYNYSLFFDCTGTSPLLSNIKIIGSTIPTIPSNLIPRDDFCKANAATCSNSSGVYCFNPSIVFGGNSAMLQLAQKYNSGDGLKSFGKTQVALQLLPSVRGESDLSAYAVDLYGFESNQNYGITVTRIEVCSN